MTRQSIYVNIMEAIFLSKFKVGMQHVEFNRHEIEESARRLGISLPKNLGDVVYSFRYRKELPESIASKASEGQMWIIRPAGRGKYCFSQVPGALLAPNRNMAVTKVPDSTPGIVARYCFSDEQALLARLRYNRLIDIFTGVTCYSLQSHLRTTVPGMGQIETDEIYVGLDKRGAHYVFPVQAKGGRDRLGMVQIEQDLAVCSHKFASLKCRPIAAQFMDNDLIALFEFEQTDEGIRVSSEKHYRLVLPDELTDKDLQSYSERLSD